MAIRIENSSSIKLPKWTNEELEKIMESVPREHLFGIEKLKLVDFINDPRLKNTPMPQKVDLPALYHPKMGTMNAWFEISCGALLRPTETYFNRLMPRMSFKTNIAAVFFSLAGQHYYLTKRHSVKRTQIESQVRQYAEKYLKVWGEKQSENSTRAKFFKPFRPLLERLAKYLNRKALESQKKQIAK